MIQIDSRGYQCLSNNFINAYLTILSMPIYQGGEKDLFNTKHLRAIKGWIIDAGINGDYIELWIKTESGITFPARVKFTPSFFLYPKHKINDFYEHDEQIKSHLSAHLNVVQVTTEMRYLNVTDEDKSRTFRVYVKSPRYFKRVVSEIKEKHLFELYNIDIPLAQMFFYENGLFPMSLCEFTVDGIIPQLDNISSTHHIFYQRNARSLPEVTGIKCLDNKERIFYKRPPLRIIKIMLDDFGERISDETNDEIKDETKVAEPDIKSGHKYRDRFTRPKHNDPLISCKILLIDGYKRGGRNKNDEHDELKRNNEYDELNKGNEHQEPDTIVIKEPTELQTIRSFSKTIERLDPDIILSINGDEFFLPYLVSRASLLHADRYLYLSRGNIPLRQNMFQMGGDSSYFSYGAILHRSKSQFYLRGRIHIDTRTYGSLHFADGNIEGVIEVSRISSVPIQRLTRITIGGALQSIQFIVALNKGYLIPPEKKNSEDFQTAMTLLQADRGGHIFEPLIGIYERVGEFDFTSMYPMIMTNYNISPDTINCSCCRDDGNKVPGLPYHTCVKSRGIVSEALMLPLNKRRAYKKMALKMPPDDAIIYKRMSDALKWILVVSFGYLGFKNARYGRVEGHQSVCAYSREIILNSRDIAESFGFEILHGIVDSIWVQHRSIRGRIVPNIKDGGRPKLEYVTHYTLQRNSLKNALNEASNNTLKNALSDTSKESTEELRNFEQISTKLASTMQEKANIPIGLDAVYKFIVFLPSRQNAEVPVLNHYWGVTYDGKIKVRGIELRRRDSPKIVKDCQQDLINILSKASGICEFMEFLKLAKKKYLEYCQRIDSEKVTADDLVIVNRVSRRAGEYKVQSYQAIASQKLLNQGIEIEPGQKVEYIIRDARSKAAGKRIILRSEFELRSRVYDKDKYKELLKRAFRNIIPFDESVIDNPDYSLNGRNDKFSIFNFIEDGREKKEDRMETRERKDKSEKRENEDNKDRKDLKDGKEKSEKKEYNADRDVSLKFSEDAQLLLTQYIKKFEKMEYLDKAVENKGKRVLITIFNQVVDFSHNFPSESELRQKELEKKNKNTLLQFIYSK